MKNHVYECEVECAIFHLVLLFWYIIVINKKENMCCFMAFHLLGPMWHIVWHNIKLCITRYMIKVSTTGILPHIWKLKRQHRIIIVWQIYALTRDFKRKKWGGILNNCHFPTILSFYCPQVVHVKDKHVQEKIESFKSYWPLHMSTFKQPRAKELLLWSQTLF